jgi:hypothetical protein
MTRGRHPASTVSLISGLLFLTMAVTGLVNTYVPMSITTVALIFASAFTLAGLIAVVAALRRPRSDDAAS